MAETRPVPSRKEILSGIAEWRLYKALGLPDKCPSARVLVQMAKILSAHADLAQRLHPVQRLLTGKSSYYQRTREAVREELQRLLDAYGPRLPDLLEARGHSVPAIVLEAAESGRKPAEALVEIADREVRKLQVLTASPSDTEIKAVAHPSVCPVCGGTGWVNGDGGDDDAGATSRVLSPQARRQRILSDPALRSRLEQEMRDQHIPSWVKPEEFAEIFDIDIAVSTVSLGLNRRKRCPRARELVFDLPPGAKEGWVLRSRVQKAGEKPEFVRVTFR